MVFTDTSPLSGIFLCLKDGAGQSSLELCKMTSLKATVNQLNFAAVKFCGLPVLALFHAVKFRVFWPTLPHKSGLNSLNNGPIFKKFSKFKVFLKLETEPHNILLFNFANLVKTRNSQN